MSDHTDLARKPAAAPPSPDRAPLRLAHPLGHTRAVQRLHDTAESLNARPALIAQRALADGLGAATVPRAPNRTGLPSQLKDGIEAMSGLSLDDVRVHRNSAKPAQLQAHAYAQGSDIHLAPGQERHLPHEAWHVVQQKQGRVKATAQLKGISINDDRGLEAEADTMGARALRVASGTTKLPPLPSPPRSTIAQLMRIDYGGAETKKWYAKQIVDTGTENAVTAAVLSSSEGSGVFLSNNSSEWEHRVGVGGKNDIMRIVLPDLQYYLENPGKLPAIMQSNGLTVTQNCELVAEHELVHLRQMSVNMKKSGHADLTTSAPSFSDAKIKETVEDLIKQTENIEVVSGHTVVSAKGKADYVRDRLRYILSTFEKGRGNIEAPTVMRELNRYFQHGTFPERFKPIIVSVKKLDEENLESLDLVPKKKSFFSFF